MSERLIDVNFHDYFLYSVRDGNDIALLRMAQYWSDARDFPSSVGTICLTTMKMPQNERITATGWGGTDAEVTQSTELKEVLHATYFH